MEKSAGTSLWTFPSQNKFPEEKKILHPKNKNLEQTLLTHPGCEIKT